MTAGGELIRAGAPLVKNVTGFDLCRLLVGSLGHPGPAGRGGAALPPRPGGRAWWVGEGADPFEVAAACTGRCRCCGTAPGPGWAWPATPADVAEQADGGARAGVPARRRAPGPARCRSAGRARPAPCGPCRPRRHVRSGAGGWPRSASGWCTARRRWRPGWRPAGRRTRPWSDLHQALKARFDPQGRLNPGRSVLAGVGSDRVAGSPAGRAGSASTPTSWPPAWPAGCAWPTARPTGSPGEEGLSPRGRIAAMRAVDAGAPADATFARLMQTCVQCRACETACPSAVPFGRLMEGARELLAPRTVPWWQRAAYRCSATTGPWSP